MVRAAIAWAALAVAATAAAAGPARADYKSGAFSQAQTRFGLLQVVGERSQQRLLFNGTDLGVTTHAYEIDGVWGATGEAHDWAVITTYHGGNMCGGFAHMILKLSGTAVARTQEFGICRGGPIDLRVQPGAIELDISDPDAFVSHGIFRFDGAALTQTSVAQAGAAQAAGAGGDVTRWLNSYPQAVTQDPGEQLRFGRIMTPAQIQEMNDRMTGPGSIRQQGNWVIGRACVAHACNAASAWWGIRISDGRPLAIFMDATDSESGAPESQTFGFGDGDWNDPEIRGFLEMILP